MSATHPLAPSRRSFNDIPPASEHVNVSSERMGLISHTLSPSPVVRWILPARIRSRRHNDVIFVGSTYIQLREFNGQAQLSDTTGKLELGTQILDAKVISAKSENVPTRDQILDQEWGEPRFIVKGASCPDDQPPQIVVLVTASSELIYVYGVNNSIEDRVELRFAKRALLEDVVLPEQHLNLMAVDPECKIMAVASQNTVTVFSLRDVDELKESIDAWDPRRPQSFQPNLEQRMLQIDGSILRMEFIRASEAEPEKALLLLVVVNPNTTKLLMYKWDTRETLDQIHALGGVPDLPIEDQFPLMIIPSFKRNSFIMVTEVDVVYYDDVRGTRFNRIQAASPPEPGIRKPLWVQWARPGRHDQYNTENEDLLLVREDGLLSVFTRPINEASAIVTSFSPGVINMGVDSAMCMLPQPRQMAGDILIVGGSMGDGGVFNLVPRDAYVKLQTIANVSPIRDMLLLEPAVSKQRIARSHRTFVTAGASGSSTLNELRLGQEAQIGWELPCPDPETVNRLWILEHREAEKLYILMSHPEHTTLMPLSLDLSDGQAENSDPDDDYDFHLNDSTLAAELLDSNCFIQITTKNVVAGSGGQTVVKSLINEGICGCADVDGVFVVACKIDTKYYIQVGLVRNLGHQPEIFLSEEMYSATSRPLSLAIFNLGSKQYLCAGRDDGGIEMFSINAEGQLSLESAYRPNDNDKAPVSSIVVIAHDVVPMALLLAGTRDGRLKVLKLMSDSKHVNGHNGFVLDRVYHIGVTPVTIAQEHTHRNSNLSAWITCGSRLDRVVCFKYDTQIDYMLISVWLTNRNKLSYVAPSLSAVQRVPYLESVSGGIPSRFLVCVTNAEIVFSSLIEQEQMVPQRLGPSEEGVRSIAYSSLIRKFVIASDPVKTSKTTSQPSETYRNSPTLQVVDPDMVDYQSRTPYRVVLGDEKDRIRVLLPWAPTDGRLHYDLIMVGLSGGASTRLGMISAKKLQPEHSSAVLKSLMKFGTKKIHAMCAFDRSSLVLSIARELILLRLSVPTKRWYEDGRYTLPSFAVSLSTQGSMIYAATKHHSTIIIRWHKETKQFEKVLSDRVARNTRMIHPFGRNGDHALVVTSLGQGTCIYGYSVKPNDLGVPISLFEAKLPEILERVSPIPTSWTESPQSAFQAITFDGAVSILQTLTNNQWKLLHFIEQMACPDPSRSVRRITTALTDRMSRGMRQERVSTFKPVKMHIHGDILKRVVDKGPQYLRHLLEPRVRNEDDMEVDNTRNSAIMKLEALAKPVVGEVSDVPEAVIIWIRKLLRATIF